VKDMIKDVEVKQLKVIKDERGWLMEILRCDDSIFKKFGQVYLTVCRSGYIKGWHYHKKQADFFAVVKGNAKLVLFDNRKKSPTFKEINEFFLGEKNPILIKIPPLVLHGFTTTENEPCFVINCPNLPYNYKNPDEFRMPFNSKEIPYDWGVKKGG